MNESTLEERPGDFPKVTQGKYLGTWEGLDTESNYLTPMFFSTSTVFGVTGRRDSRNVTPGPMSNLLNDF